MAKRRTFGFIMLIVFMCVLCVCVVYFKEQNKIKKIELHNMDMERKNEDLALYISQSCGVDLRTFVEREAGEVKNYNEYEVNDDDHFKIVFFIKDECEEEVINEIQKKTRKDYVGNKNDKVMEISNSVGIQGEEIIDWGYVDLPCKYEKGDRIARFYIIREKNGGIVVYTETIS